MTVNRAHVPVLLATLAMAACAAPPPPPLVSLADRTCAARPDLGIAMVGQLVLEKDLRAALGVQSPCIEWPDHSKSTYAAFALPDLNAPYLIRVSSAPDGEALLWPRVVLLDGLGKTVREIGRDRFLPHGNTLQAGIRMSPPGRERYLLVASDPLAAGTQASRVIEQLNIAYYFGNRTIVTPSDSTVTQTFAHNGTITVRAEPMPIQPAGKQP